MFSGRVGPGKNLVKSYIKQGLNSVLMRRKQKRYNLYRLGHLKIIECTNIIELHIFSLPHHRPYEREQAALQLFVHPIYQEHVYIFVVKLYKR